MKHEDQRSGGGQGVGNVMVREWLSHRDNDPLHTGRFAKR